MSWENQAEEIQPGEKHVGAKGAKKGEIKAAIKEMNLLDEVDDLLDMPGVSDCLCTCVYVARTSTSAHIDHIGLHEREGGREGARQMLENMSCIQLATFATLICLVFCTPYCDA